MHLGHLILARDALEQLGLRRVLLVPALRSPLRTAEHVATFDERLAMLRAVARDHPWLDVLDIERGLPQPSYTLNTVHALRARFPTARLVWLIGADQLARLPEWHEPEALAHLLEFAVAARPGFPAAAPPLPGLRAHLLRPRNIDISSTELRQRLAKGLPIDHLVPAQIVHLIQLQGLYRQATA
jgi:nicotinate-nucleotide adenylyltransferase